MTARRKRPPSAPRPLPAKQERFVDEYLIGLNATQAAIRAGYSAKNADKIGSQLLGKTRVAAAIAEAQRQRAARTGITADQVLTELETVAFSDIGDIMDFTGDQLRMKAPSEIPERARRAISSVKVRRYVEGRGEDAQTVEVVEFKLWSKPDALQRMGDHLGLWKNPLAASIDECRRLLARIAGVPEAALPP